MVSILVLSICELSLIGISQFEMRLPARKFRKYVCTGRVNDDRSSSKASVERIEDMNSNEKTTAEAIVSAK